MRLEANSDVLVARSTPLNFSGNFLAVEGKAEEELQSAESCGSTFRSSPTLDIRAPFGSGSFVENRLLNPGSDCFVFIGRNEFEDSQLGPSPTLTAPGNPEHLRRIPSSDRRQTPKGLPRRPCLVERCSLFELPSSRKNKKKVVFADDRGFPLALVRTMTEPSNVPPLYSFRFLPCAAKDLREISEPWEMGFPQPASNYLDFRQRLDVNNVSLENVIVKEHEQLIVGTVKVRNLAFHKDVFVRNSFDDWITQEDTFCKYVPNTSSIHGVSVLYDTFSFRLSLPPTSRKIEFCVCFRCSGREYWDNHSGKNYFLAKKDSSIQMETSGHCVPEEKVYVRDAGTHC